MLAVANVGQAEVISVSLASKVWALGGGGAEPERPERPALDLLTRACVDAWSTAATDSEGLDSKPSKASSMFS